MKKRSVSILGHATSLSLEEPFWKELKKIAATEKISLNALIAKIDAAEISPNLSSAARIYVLRTVKRR